MKLVGVDPVGSMYYDKFHSGKDIKPETYLVEGIGEDFYPTTMDLSLLDDILRIDDKTCFTVARKLARQEGIFSGGSTGAAVWGALEYAKRNKLGPDDIVVTMACDHGLRYLSKVYSEQWLRENGMLASEYELAAHQLIGAKRSGPAQLVSVSTETSAADALRLLKEHDVSQMPLTDAANAVVGSLQEAQLVELFLSRKDLSTVKVQEVMGEPFPTVSSDAPLEDVASKLTRENPAVLVTGAEGALGIVTKFDLIAHIAR